jgi:hypothetical protein
MTANLSELYTRAASLLDRFVAGENIAPILVDIRDAMSGLSAEETASRDYQELDQFVSSYETDRRFKDTIAWFRKQRAAV